MKRTLLLEGRAIPYELTQKPVKNINIRVHADGSVKVSAGPWVSPEAVDAVLRQRSAFLLRALDQFAAKPPCARNPTPTVQGIRSTCWAIPIPSASSQVLRLRFGRRPLTFSSRCRSLRILSAGCGLWRPF